MSATADHADGKGSGVPSDVSKMATRLGLEAGWVVQEIGYDDDCDDDLRDAIREVTGEDFVGDDTDEVVDAVLLWFREDDGDLVDAFFDILTDLKAGGVVWLMTPKVGRDGYVETSDIAEAAPVAGLATTSTLSVTDDWSATKLVVPKSGRRG
ncbi:DUF3052 domain-containing protein [Kribbella sp. NPDC048915]|uniref:DUF3052 domain-containing protein n=1 Tax=Kribbella sp. NPDC048915 TaxID=3155148 RepID=UPI0033BFF16A